MIAHVGRRVNRILQNAFHIVRLYRMEDKLQCHNVAGTN
jgi:hypothetical protein